MSQTRSSSASVVPYWRWHSAVATQTGASTAPAGFPFYIGNPTGTASAQTLSEAHMGGSIGATLNLALYTRLQTYMTAVGVP